MISSWKEALDQTGIAGIKDVSNLLIDQQQIDDFLPLCLDSSYRYKALWILTHVQNRNPALLIGFQNQLIDFSIEIDNYSELRNILLLLYKIPYSDYREGEVIDKMATLILNRDIPVATRVNAIYVFLVYIKKYPELLTELNAIKSLLVEEKFPSLQAAIRKIPK